MAEIDRYRQEDRRQVEALYRRVFGPDAAEANRLRWEWQYRRNPHVASEGPLIWLAREGATVIGQYATMPVRLSLGGREIHVRNAAAYLQDGTLAGSVTTMDRVFKFLVHDVGLTLPDAAQLCSATPASELELTDSGTITKGAIADLVVLDQHLDVAQTYVGGRLVYGR